MSLDINTLRGVITLVLLLAFIGVWVWAWSKRRRSDFEESAALPLEEDDVPVRDRQQENS